MAAQTMWVSRAMPRSAIKRHSVGVEVETSEAASVPERDLGEGGEDVDDGGDDEVVGTDIFDSDDGLTTGCPCGGDGARVVVRGLSEGSFTRESFLVAGGVIRRVGCLAPADEIDRRRSLSFTSTSVRTLNGAICGVSGGVTYDGSWET